MSAGKRYKFNGSDIQLLTSFDESSPGPLNVSAITKANPAVATLNSTTSLGATGDIAVIKIDNVEGMIEVNEEAYIVQVINGTTVTLLGVNSTGYGTLTGAGNAYPGTFSDWCEVTGLNRQGGSSPEIDGTTVCSEWAEFDVGLPDFGTASIDFKYAPMTNLQQVMEAWHTSGEKTAIRYNLPRSGGQRTVLGFVQQTGEQGSNGQHWTGSMTFRATGAPVTVTPA